MAAKPDESDLWLPLCSSLIVKQDLQLMMAARSETVDRLSDPRWEYRYVALVLLHYHWQPSLEESAVCFTLAGTDPDPRVRAEAYACLGVIYKRSGDKAVLSFLAACVMNENETPFIRYFAYRKMYAVLGRFCRMPIPLPDDYKVLLKSVNWDFVRQFRREGD